MLGHKAAECKKKEDKEKQRASTTEEEVFMIESLCLHEERRVMTGHTVY